MIEEENTRLIFPQKNSVEINYKIWEAGDYPLHYHNYYEIEIVTSGKGSQNLNGAHFNLNPKDIFLLKPLDYHKIHSDNIGFAHLAINEGLVSKWIIKKLSLHKKPTVFHLNDFEYESFLNVFKILENELKETKENMLNAKSTLIDLIFIMFIKLDKNLANMNNDSIVSKVIYFLLTDYRFTEDVTLDEIAKNIGYSKFYTSSMFHKEYGITIQDFIIKQRIEYAKKLILETDYSMTEIIGECGFSSASNFYSKFTKIVGCSPLKFKQQNKEKLI